jgi:hypothetical protein
MEDQGTFKIAEPCHADWNQMSAETQGRFCAACQRCVIDFTQMTSTQIKASYDQANGDVCGRVKVSQVQHQRPAMRSTLSKMRTGALKGIQMFALALMLAFTGLLHTEVQAQKEIMGKVAYVPENNRTTEIFGRVITEEGDDATGAEVTLYQDGVVIATTFTDAKGLYRLPRIQSGEFELHASDKEAGTESRFIHVTAGKPQREDFQLQEIRIMGAMEYIPELPILPIVPIERQEMLEIQDPIATPIAEDLLPSTEKSHAVGESIVFADFSVRVFPNPTTDKVTLTVDIAGNENLVVTLLNIDGKTVYEGVWLRFMEAQKVIDMQGLPAGIYLLRLQAGEAVVNRQLLKI